MLLLLTFVSAYADNEVIGTVQFSLDGDEQTWYVLESPEGLRSNALWVEAGPDRYAIAVTAFASPDVELVPYEATGSAVPDGSAPALIVSVGFPAGASEQTHTLPIDPATGPAVVMLLNDWADPLDSATLTDGPGEISLTSIDANREGSSSFAGTFSGALEDGEGNARMIESGRFEFDKVSFFARP